MREFFPDNAVEYFVSYYDYYQPEAYIPRTDTYIEKDSAINDEIDRLRHSATAALLERRDVVIVASVSCIYGLGDPIDYRSMVISCGRAWSSAATSCAKSWWKCSTSATTSCFIRNVPRARRYGGRHPAYMSELAIRVEFFGDEIERITEINPLTGERWPTTSTWPSFRPSTYRQPGQEGWPPSRRSRGMDEQVKRCLQQRAS
jgi:excinuclease ABC subunit B